MTYNLSDYDYDLPLDLIATSPSKKRDHSRLLTLSKENGQIAHHQFFDLPDLLQAGDVLVLNNTRVIPARLIGKKRISGGRVEIFLHKKKNDDWEVLVGGKNLKPGQIIDFNERFWAEIRKNNEDGTWLVSFNLSGKDFVAAIEEVGQVPLPPYIKKENRDTKMDDRTTYQTVYADEEKSGSVAAPTAGLHFTKELLDKLKQKGVEVHFLTLQVGLGTFAPVKANDIREHKMHAEFVELEASVCAGIFKAKKEGRRVVAVGTTSTRALEAILCSLTNDELEKTGYSGWVNIFIYPGIRFKVVDAMITNFHLPKSSLIMLVSALAGKENIDKAYKAAIENKYRFYSYGDAMFIY